MSYQGRFINQKSRNGKTLWTYQNGWKEALERAVILEAFLNPEVDHSGLKWVQHWATQGYLEGLTDAA